MDRGAGFKVWYTCVSRVAVMSDTAVTRRLIVFEEKSDRFRRNFDRKQTLSGEKPFSENAHARRRNPCQTKPIEGAHQSVVALGSFGAHRHHFVAQGRGLRGALPCVRFVCSGRDELIVLWTYGALEPYALPLPHGSSGDSKLISGNWFLGNGWEIGDALWAPQARVRE